MFMRVRGMLRSEIMIPHVETVCLLFQLKQKPDDYINVTIELDDVDITSAETKATYDEIKKYVAEHNAGMKVSNLYISQVKRKCGIEVGKNLSVVFINVLNSMAGIGIGICLGISFGISGSLIFSKKIKINDDTTSSLQNQENRDLTVCKRLLTRLKALMSMLLDSENTIF